MSLALYLGDLEAVLPAGWIWLIRNDGEGCHFANICSPDHRVTFPSYGGEHYEALRHAIRRFRDWSSDQSLGSPGEVADCRPMPAAMIQQLNRQALQ